MHFPAEGLHIYYRNSKSVGSFTLQGTCCESRFLACSPSSVLEEGHNLKLYLLGKEVEIAPGSGEGRPTALRGQSQLSQGGKGMLKSSSCLARRDSKNHGVQTRTQYRSVSMCEKTLILTN